jgi:FAD/FMN-containing dehydrogenase
MTQDGAHLGYGMDAALRGALGGEEPKERLTVEKMRKQILSASDHPKSYDETGRACAKVILGFLERHPEASEMPADSEGEFGKFADGTPNWNDYHVVREGLYEYIKRSEPALYEQHEEAIFGELTGFMWGWAVNAARRCLELPPVANPAIIEVNLP